MVLRGTLGSACDWSWNKGGPYRENCFSSSWRGTPVLWVLTALFTPYLDAQVDVLVSYILPIQSGILWARNKLLYDLLMILNWWVHSKCVVLSSTWVHWWVEGWGTARDPLNNRIGIQAYYIFALSFVFTVREKRKSLFINHVSESVSLYFFVINCTCKELK